MARRIDPAGRISPRKGDSACRSSVARPSQRTKYGWVWLHLWRDKSANVEYEKEVQEAARYFAQCSSTQRTFLSRVQGRCCCRQRKACRGIHCMPKRAALRRA
jgi:hypothetical protein